MSVERARQLRKIMPAPEAKLWNALRALKPLHHHFRRQVPFGHYIADFACHRARLIIEVDGDTHFSDAGQKHDRVRDAFLSAEGYRVLRVTNLDVMRNIDGVIEVVLAALEQASSPR
ncbi:Very-short-patch-repair endonuclease [Devosia sp. YR412]|uniref:endonuclease domain-containing protein n=1 Tax=Devosia sp. YR412 TaxID=1881030 RepID=UPI0008CD4615|nr:endonuclease domain-containing protein [Devosia sp. YR412]SEP66583.1 Very-short-patch-repair endonuclease [Devosia sp. YR412]